jgi:hypothetical protein
MLKYKDYVEIELRDEEGSPIPNEKYIMYLSNGEVRKGKLDDRGQAKVEEVPPKAASVRFPSVGPVDRTGKEGEQ